MCKGCVCKVCVCVCVLARMLGKCGLRSRFPKFEIAPPKNKRGFKWTKALGGQKRGGQTRRAAGCVSGTFPATQTSISFALIGIYHKKKSGTLTPRPPKLARRNPRAVRCARTHLTQLDRWACFLDALIRS